MNFRKLQPVNLYVAAVAATGCLLFAMLARVDLDLLVQSPIRYWVLAGLVVLGELLPIKVSRRAEEEEITTSMTFAFALVLSSGLTAAIIAQGVASLVTDIVRRKPPWKAAFNLGQYTLSLAACASVLTLLTGEGLSGPVSLDGTDLPAVALAAAAFFATNFMLVVVAVALAQSISARAYLKQDFAFFASSSAVLLAMSPLVVAAADFSLPFIFLLALPLAAVHKSASVSVENARLVVNLEQSLAQLTEMNRLKDDFVASVSHELRTPLTVIQGFVKTLLRSDVTFGEEDRRAFLEAADRNSERLHRLIEQLLVVARLESETESAITAPVNVESVARRVVDELSSQVAGHTFEFDFDEALPQLMSDEGKIHQILSNLVENALKYAPRETRVAVVARRTGNDVVVSVVDEGGGIPEDLRERIFDRFFQVDSSSTRTVGGTGLGLYICRRLAKELGGELLLERSDEQGSVFTLHVPVAGADADAGDDVAVDAPAAQPLPGPVPSLVRLPVGRRSGAA